MNIPLDRLTKVKSFGFSMYPLLHNGDVISFKKVAFSKLEVDDIVIVNNKTKYFTHRIIYKAKSYCITKGDRNYYSDGKIKPGRILGKVISIKRNNTTLQIDTLSFLHNSFYLREIKLVADLFSIQKISYVFLKGMPIYYYYTKKMPQRLYADCDILVSEDDYERAKELLVKNDYVLQKEEGFIRRLSQPFLMEEDLVKSKDGYTIMIDLHKRPFSFVRKFDFPDALYPKEYMDEFTKKLLNTRKTVLFKQAKIYIPSSDYLILFLAIHFFTHTMKKIHRLELISMIIRKDKKKISSWNSLLKLIEYYQCNYMVYPALYFMSKLYPESIPSKVLEQIRPVNAKRYYKLDPMLVFDERVSVSRVINKLKIAWVYSPNPLAKRFALFVSPEVYIFALSYGLIILNSLVMKAVRKLRL